MGDEGWSYLYSRLKMSLKPLTALFMELPDEFFGPPTKSEYLQHAVIVHFIYYKDSLDPLHELDRKLRKVIREQGVGLYDGHEIAIDDSDGFLYMYGPNAENLFRVVKPIL